MTLHKVQCQDLAPHMYIWYVYLQLPHAVPRNAMRQFPSAIILKNMPHFGACQRSVHSHSISRSFIHSFNHSCTRSLTHRLVAALIGDSCAALSNCRHSWSSCWHGRHALFAVGSSCHAATLAATWPTCHLPSWALGQAAAKLPTWPSQVESPRVAP